MWRAIMDKRAYITVLAMLLSLSPFALATHTPGGCGSIGSPTFTRFTSNVFDCHGGDVTAGTITVVSDWGAVGQTSVTWSNVGKFSAWSFSGSNGGVQCSNGGSVMINAAGDVTISSSSVINGAPGGCGNTKGGGSGGLLTITTGTKISMGAYTAKGGASTQTSGCNCGGGGGGLQLYAPQVTVGVISLRGGDSASGPWPYAQGGGGGGVTFGSSSSRVNSLAGSAIDATGGLSTTNVGGLAPAGGGIVNLQYVTGGTLGTVTYVTIYTPSYVSYSTSTGTAVVTVPMSPPPPPNVAPSVTVTHSPTSPDQREMIALKATASDNTGISSLSVIYRLNGGPWVTLSCGAVTSCTQWLAAFNAGSAIDYYATATDTASPVLTTTSSISSFTVSEGRANMNLNFYGKARDKSGKPLSQASVFFEMFDSPTSSTPFWTHTNNSIPIAGGKFNTTLGLPPASALQLWRGDQYYLNVTISNATTFSCTAPAACNEFRIPFVA